MTRERDQHSPLPPGQLPDRSRRRDDRRPIDSVVRVELLPGAIEGSSRDLSNRGLLLFSSERLPVRVTFEEEGRTIEVVGRLVRVQRTSNEHVAYAIEFDRELDSEDD